MTSNSRLLQRSLGEQDGEGASIRSRLRVALELFRERAALVAGEIARDLPDFTVHDINHIDALWDIADLIVGDDYPLTPTESFVLGGAFLLHDLGLGLAAYPEGTRELSRNPMWWDVVARSLGEQYDPSRFRDWSDVPDHVRVQATQFVLRELHAERAGELAFVSWRDPQSSTDVYLIDDVQLRLDFGRIIGRIAESHWWPISRLQKEFGFVQGSPTGWPRGWTLDPLKLACILRVSDAAQVDARRAPMFLRLIREPAHVSVDHWLAQERLNQPILDRDRLAFSSTRGFAPTEASAWWVCFDLLRVLDRELREADALLADTSRVRFAAKGVAGVDDPVRLAQFVRPEGWLPVDARIQVTDVPNLVRSLGGEQLYGDRFDVPIRELIQNASDAVRARRCLEEREDGWGTVTVEVGEEDGETWLEVRDTGLGMPTEVLTGSLLDFGASFWQSSAAYRTYPRLFASGFRSTGRYGIGFFSAFMLGDRVRVITRALDQSTQDTQVLEVSNGPQGRPLLRAANMGEYLKEAGTSVRVWLNDAMRLRLMRILQREPFPEYLARLCPTIDVDVVLRVEGRDVRVLTANDWLTIPGDQLLRRLSTDPVEKGDHHDLVIDGRNLRVLRDSNGTPVGRAGIMISLRENSRVYRDFTGVVTVGGFRASRLDGLVGAMLGIPQNAARDSAIPLVSSDVLAQWASAQAQIVSRLHIDESRKSVAALIIRACGGEVDKLPIAYSSAGWLTEKGIARLARTCQTFFIVDRVDYNLDLLEWNPALDIEAAEDVELRGDVLITDTASMILLLGQTVGEGSWPLDLLPNRSASLYDAVLAVFAKAWKASVPEVISCSSGTFELPVKRVVGTYEGEDVEAEGVIIRRPQSEVTHPY